MRQPLAALAVALLACASSSPVRLDRVQGVYTTHFDGVPDDAAVCAVVSNAGHVPLAWMRLRLRAYSTLGDEPARWSATWLLEAPLAPGEAVALELHHPPVADEIELRVLDAGSGSPPRAVRLARRSESCSNTSLERVVAERAAGREAPGIAVHRIARRGAPAEDELLARKAEPDRAPAN
jgi:hypothetical protein